MYAFQTPGGEPNRHALAALAQASERYAIVASRDIVDVRGVKLWAAGQPVSAALQQRLLDRRLQKPMEVCLMAEDGVTPFSLLSDLTAFIESTHPLAACIRPWAATLLAQVRHVPLHPVVQLMLTASLATRPATLPHAVAAMALAGAMIASQQGTPQDVRLAMLGGLLHDLGEVYIHPQYLDYGRPLDLLGHKHLVIHPRVGEMLISSLTDYPAVLARAVGEHHERLDRSGYPARLQDAELSRLGRALAVTEVVLGMTRWPDAPLTRASFALRVVPGEFAPEFAAFVWDAARSSDEVPAGTAPAIDLYQQLADIDQQLVAAQQLGQELREQGRTLPVIEIVDQAMQRLDRLRVAWNALGLWRVSSGDAPQAERFELELAHAELRLRLRSVQRECLLLSERLGEAEKLRLAPLWRGLAGSS
ncbi:MAG: HD-GYP domain-containing protein [Rhizobacter sp.]|jgi:hypothetical protein